MAADTPTPDEDEARVRPFSDFLREHAKGRTHDDLSKAMQDLIGAVKDTEKPGSITLKINVRPLKSNHEVLEVSDQIVVKKPQHDRKTSLFYADRDNNLVRDNPDQFEFEGMRDVSAAPASDKAKEKRA